MSTTKLTCARDSFASLKTTFAGISTKQSESEFIIEQPESGTRQIKVRFDGDPARPGLIIVTEAKPNLLPYSVSGDPVEIEPTTRRFDAFHDGTTFGWLDPSDEERQRDNAAIESLIRELV